MSRRPDRTTTRGYDAAFHTTHWTEIFDARSEDEPRQREALEHISRAYWKPVYCYLRRKGYEKEAAKDLTQGFFCDVVLGRGLVQQAERAKGKFRTFLLRCLNRYVANIHRAQRAKQRMPEGGVLHLEEIARAEVPEAVRYAAPDEAFDYAWASALLDGVLADVRGRCREKGNATHWDLFQERVLIPAMHNTESPPLADLCEKYDVESKLRASNMVFTVKRCFRSLLRRRVRQFVGSDEEVDEEFSHLMEIFSRGTAIF